MTEDDDREDTGTYLRTTLGEIKDTLDERAKMDVEQNGRLSTIETAIKSRETDLTQLTKDLNERAGSTKTTARWVKGLGGTVLAALVALFILLWNGNADSARRDAAIERISHDQVEHEGEPHAAHPVEPRDVIAVGNRVDLLKGSVNNIRDDVAENKTAITTLRERRRRR